MQNVGRTLKKLIGFKPLAENLDLEIVPDQAEGAPVALVESIRRSEALAEIVDQLASVIDGVLLKRFWRLRDDTIKASDDVVL